MSEPSWSDIERAKVQQTAPTVALDMICARVLSTTDGLEMLKLLRDRHFETSNNPLADDRALRVRAANQQFILDLERHRDRGMAALAAKKTV